MREAPAAPLSEQVPDFLIFWLMFSEKAALRQGAKARGEALKPHFRQSRPAAMAFRGGGAERIRRGGRSCAEPVPTANSEGAFQIIFGKSAAASLNAPARRAWRRELRNDIRSLRKRMIYLRYDIALSCDDICLWHMRNGYYIIPAKQACHAALPYIIN